MEVIREDKIKEAAHEICAVFDKLELNGEERFILANSVYQIALLWVGRRDTKSGILQYLPTVISLVAIIISAFSIAATLMK